MYPRLKDGVSMGTFSYEEDPQTRFYVENENQDMFEITYPLYCELSDADGTHPLQVTQRVLKQLKKDKILTTSRWEFVGHRGRFLLFALGNGVKKYRPLCRLVNRLLPFVSVLMLLAALAFRHKAMLAGDNRFSLPGLLLLLAVSLGIHESGHLIAGIAYGQLFSEIGVLFWGPFPIGAYVLRASEGELPREKNLQLYLAGIQMNLIFAGFLILSSAASIFCAGTFYTIAQINLLMAFINLLPADSLDGSHVLGTLLGIKDLKTGARQFMSSKEYRHRLFHARAKGCRQILAFLLYFVATAAIRILVACDFLCVLLYIILLLM